MAKSVMQKHWIAAKAIGAEYGFELVFTNGRGHAKLVRAGHRPVGVPSSPRNEHEMLRGIRKNLADSVRVASEREATVDG